jgi:hypothetical protein
MNIDHHRQDDETSLEVVADRVVHRRYVPHSAAHYAADWLMAPTPSHYSVMSLLSSA